MDLQQISDRLEIADVITHYTIAIDTGDWDALDRVFTPDAEIDYTESGGIAAGFGEVKAWLAEMLPIFPQRMHTIGQVAVDHAGSGPSGEPGDEAEVAAYFDNPMLLPTGDGGHSVVEIGGIYRHTMLRTADGWRSRRLHEQVVWKRGI